MNNPYDILGVSPNASKDEIRTAYKELVKKYHPDRYCDNPLKDLAVEKMKEINEAYDFLIKNQDTSQNTNYSNNSNHTNNDTTFFSSIRHDISRGDFFSAEKKLNSATNRPAEWHYLMGIVASRKGWHESAHNHIRTACSLDPNNQEYAQAFNAMNTRNTGYRDNYYGRRSSSDDICNTCLQIWCLDSICECMGCDCISCI